MIFSALSPVEFRFWQEARRLNNGLLTDLLIHDLPISDVRRSSVQTFWSVIVRQSCSWFILGMTFLLSFIKFHGEFH